MCHSLALSLASYHVAQPILREAVIAVTDINLALAYLSLSLF